MSELPEVSDMFSCGTCSKLPCVCATPPMTPRALTREQVEALANGLITAGVSFEQRLAIRSLMENDGNLRHALAQLTEEMTALLEGKPLENGLYVHHPFCNGDRRKPAGTPGVTCSCKVVSRDALPPPPRSAYGNEI